MVFRKLLSLFAVVDAHRFAKVLRSQDGWTALMTAAFAGELEVCNVLLAAGAKVNAKCKDGDTALHYASTQGQQEVIRRLVKAKANIQARLMGLYTFMCCLRSFGRPQLLSATAPKPSDAPLMRL